MLCVCDRERHREQREREREQDDSYRLGKLECFVLVGSLVGPPTYLQKYLSSKLWHKSQIS